VVDISASELTGFGLASVLLRAAVSPLSIRGLAGGGDSPDGSASGEGLFSGPIASQGAGVTLLGTGPNQWLAYADDAAPDWAETLGDTLAGVAGVVDQSSAYTLWQITGANARRLLQKGVPVDLWAIVPGAVVVSAIAHLGVIIHHTAPDSFHVFVFRSFAINFRDWLDASIAAL
jgi:sarcosine oxidase subunit gamma